MRFSLKKRICAVLLCISAVLMSGCFPVHSILGETTDYVIPGDKELDIGEFKMNNNNQSVTGVYPDGQRAFMFKDCTYEADIDNFRLIDMLGSTMVYFYTGIKVRGVNGENRKDYYDRETAKLTYFWTIAAYNFDTGYYKTIKTLGYAAVDSEITNGNPAKLYTSENEGKYLVNVGFDYYLFSLSSDDGFNFYYNDDIAKWSLSGEQKEEIRESLGIKTGQNSFCCTDMAVKVTHSLKFAATFMALPDKSTESFEQDNVMYELHLQAEQEKDDNDRIKVNRYIDTKKKASNVLTTAGGNIISSNPDAGNCIYVLDEGSKNIKFGIDNRDRKTSFKISVKNQSAENKVLQSFSVENWYDDKGNVSDEESILELVFKNRVEYYKIERYNPFIGVIEYRAKHLKTYPLDVFTSNYLSSDDMPSIGYYSHGINLCSTETGFKCIDTDGNIKWQRLKNGAAYFSAPYGEKTLVVGFNDFKFDKTVRTYDDKGKLLSVSESKSEFTLAQLPFATVRIY